MLIVTAVIAGGIEERMGGLFGGDFAQSWVCE